MTGALSLAGTWAELVTALSAAGLVVEQDVPDMAQPGTVIVSADDPYLQQGQTFSSLQVNLRLSVVFAVAQADAFSAEANKSLLDALDAIPARWAIRGASAPFRATNLGGLITSVVRISTDTQESDG